MQHSKVVCSDCSHFNKCSKQTRMYINYCGPRTKALKSHIVKAAAECRNHRGMAFKFNILIPTRKILKLKQCNQQTPEK